MKERVQGKTEEIKGKVTGNRRLETKGKARQKVGEVKEAAKSIAHDLEHSGKKR
ncbi:MAG: CsbD family protein [Isosphaeraceae bacterium]